MYCNDMPRGKPKLTSSSAKAKPRLPRLADHAGVVATALAWFERRGGRRDRNARFLRILLESGAPRP